MGRKTLVIAESQDNQIRQVSVEALAAGKVISGDAKVNAVLLGKDLKPLAEQLIHYGADKVIVIENDKLENYTPGGYFQAIRQVIESEEPEAIVTGHTAVGKDVSAKLAGKLNSGLISDVIRSEERRVGKEGR